MKFKQLTVAFMIFGLIFSEIALAGRFGGGRSRGMQRNIAPAQYNKPYNSNYAPTGVTKQQPTASPAAQPRSGMGAGTAAMLGAAAGAAGGYMLGKSAAENNTANSANINNNASSANSSVNTANTLTAPEERLTTSNTPTSNNIPWGIVVILLLLLGVGLMFFRKRTDNNTSGNNTFANPKNNFGDNANNKFSGFNLPKFKRQPQETAIATSNIADGHHGSTPNLNQGAIPNVANTTRMPDGIETIYFLRQVKGMFLHIQSMNNPENLTEVAKYLTPELYLELQTDIANNTAIADFSNLDCTILNCEKINNTLVASVQFTGLVSEDPTQAATPFTEIWNFLKPEIATNKWLVAGIQHPNTPTTV